MRPITITQRLRPFSHRPGVRCIIPGTNLSLQAFPLRIVLFDSCGTEADALVIEGTGPVNGFTLMQDLEKGSVIILGHASEGYYRISFAQDISGELTYRVEKSPSDSFIRQEQQLLVHSTPTFPRYPPERLSLGSHKKLDWDLVTRRYDLCEIIPCWLRLATMTPSEQDTSFLLLQHCSDLIANKDREALEVAFSSLALRLFDDILLPQKRDDRHQGLFSETLDDPYSALSATATLIRSLFLTVEDNTIAILPALPVAFHCGRYINIPCGEFGTIDIEWSKKLIRRMTFSSTCYGELIFTFQRSLRSFRLRTNMQPATSITCNTPITVASGTLYHFDNFRK